MSLYVGALYHWAPKRLRAAILREGLRVCIPSRMTPEACFAYVCFGTTPSTAWSLVLETESEEDGWDLWQARAEEGDPLLIRGDFSPFVREVRILRAVPVDRLWWVGERGSHYAHDGIGVPAPPAPREPKRRRRAAKPRR